MYKTKFLRLIVKNTLFKWLKDSRVKPSHLLLFRIIFAVATGIVLFFGEYLISLIFLGLYQFVFLVDYADGAIARYRNQFSHKWRRIDRTSHYLISSLFLLGIGFAHGFQVDSIYPVLIASIGALSVILVFTIDTIWLSKSISFDELVKIHDKQGIFTPIYSFLPIDGAFNLFFIFFVFNWIYFSIVFFTIMYLMIAAKKLINLSRWQKRKR